MPVNNTKSILKAMYQRELKTTVRIDPKNQSFLGKKGSFGTCI
jgi:hypothetical protein